MVYHADPQLLVKLRDRSIQFLQGADEVVDLCNPAHILLGGCLFKPSPLWEGSISVFPLHIS